MKALVTAVDWFPYNTSHYSISVTRINWHLKTVLVNQSYIAPACHCKLVKNFVGNIEVKHRFFAMTIQNTSTFIIYKHSTLFYSFTINKCFQQVLKTGPSLNNTQQTNMYVLSEMVDVHFCALCALCSQTPNR